MVTRAFIDLDMTGDTDGVMRMLRHLDTCFSVGGMTQFLGGDVAPYLRLRARGRFDEEGDDAVGSWAPLSQTSQRIRAHGAQTGQMPGITATHPINRRTGLMEDYITNGVGDVTPEGSGNISLHYPRRSVPARQGLQRKVRRAQLGDARTPARPVLGVSETDLFYVVSKLAFFIQKGPM